jgi:hypothetical protein
LLLGWRRRITLLPAALERLQGAAERLLAGDGAARLIELHLRVLVLGVLRLRGENARGDA